jgi:hypothetical protein
VGSIVNLNAVKNRKISCSYWEPNPGHPSLTELPLKDVRIYMCEKTLFLNGIQVTLPEIDLVVLGLRGGRIP